MRCKKCGSPMAVKKIERNNIGTEVTIYYCKGKRCKNKQHKLNTD